MKPLRARIGAEAVKKKVPQPIIEKDYALSYILAGISRHKSLKSSLIFKGGTALKKLHFGDYRFSEDLDYSAVQAPRGEGLAAALEAAAQESKRLLSDQGPFEITLRRYEERDPHPQGQEAFTFHVQFPWHPSPLCRIKVEIAHDEPVIMPPTTCSLIHGYEERLEVKIRSYQLIEILAEKLRALLQTHEKLATRGRTRPRARDYYDLWRLFSKYGKAFSRAKLAPLLEKKCEHRQVAFHVVDDFFTKELVSEGRTHWQSTLGTFVNDLPPFDKAIGDLRRHLQGCL